MNRIWNSTYLIIFVFKQFQTVILRGTLCWLLCCSPIYLFIKNIFLTIHIVILPILRNKQDSFSTQ